MPLNEGRETTLPKVGRWICITVCDNHFKYKIIQHGPGKGALARDERGVLVCLEVFYNWKYIEEPSVEELVKCTEERFGYNCNFCDKASTSLQMCDGCMEVRYCDTDCQSNDWETHKHDCSKVKLVLQPNPRYPLAQVNQDHAKAQKTIQDKMNTR